MESPPAPRNPVAPVNSTDFGAFVSGTAQKITFGASAETITEVGAAGGEAADVLVETIHRKRGFNLPGRETPLVFTMGSLWVVTDPALVEFNKASRTRSLRAVRFLCGHKVGMFDMFDVLGLRDGAAAA